MAINKSHHDNETKSWIECPPDSGIPAKRVYICNPSDLFNTDSTDQAGETISATKALYLDSGELFLGKPDDTYAKAQIVGIAITSATTGLPVKYRTSGEFYDSSFSFTVGNLVFLDTNGGITETDPLSLGHNHRVALGKVIASNGIFIQIEEPIIL